MHMLHAIVVEDERNIREGIGRFIETVSDDFQLDALFSDGDEAIEYLKDHAVDLVVTDIKMSRVSGIELAKYVDENCPATLTLLLSGYRDFEYAKSAMAYHVYDYLLKPTNYNELEQTLEKMARELRRRQSEMEHNNNYEALLPEFRKEFFVSLLTGTFRKTEIIENKAALLKLGKNFISSNCAPVEVLISEGDDFFQTKWKYAGDSFYTAIENLILIAPQTPSCKLYFVGDYHCNGICIFASMTGVSDCERSAKILEESLNVLTEAARQMMSCELRFAVEAIYEDPIKLASRRKESEENFPERVMLLKTYISMGNEEEARLLADRMFDEMQNNTLQYIKGRVLEIFRTLYDNEQANGDHVDPIIAAETAEEIKKAMTAQLASMMNRFGAACDSEQNLVITRAKQYIEKNFSQDISLRDVANHVYLNAIYFSRYFKEHTQKNFSDYLTDVRISFAKQELGKGKKIDDVCRLSGYRNSSYFAKIFKSNTGMTPSEYQRTKIGCD